MFFLNVKNKFLDNVNYVKNEKFDSIKYDTIYKINILRTYIT